VDLIPRDLRIAISGEIPKYLTKDEVHRVLDVIPKDKVRDHLMIHLLWHTGVRVSELISISAPDIDFYARTLIVTTLKQKKGKAKKIQRSIPILTSPESKCCKPGWNIFDEIEDYLEVWYLVHRYCRKAGIDSKRSHPHVFRHSFGINTVLQGVAPGTLAGWLGHASLGSTMIYSKVLAKDTRQIMEGLEF
jgi:integrase/recombinase XerD